MQASLELPEANTRAAGFSNWSVRIECDIRVDIVRDVTRLIQNCDRRIFGRNARIAQHSWLI